jgi:NADH-quinone oxidoreductase subunit N
MDTVLSTPMDTVLSTPMDTVLSTPMDTVQSIDHAALAPVYAVVAAAVLVLLVDLIAGPGRPWVRVLLLALGGSGPVVALVLGATVARDRATFCTPGGVLPGGVRTGASCSFVVGDLSTAVTVLGCGFALAVLALSAALLRSGTPGIEAVTKPSGGPADPAVPIGEYVFLLLCSLAGLVVLGAANDLLTLIVALETLTLPVYVLVGLVHSGAAGTVRSAEAAVTFFATSVVSTALTLLGVGLLYGIVGAVHLDRVALALAGRADARDLPLVAGAVVLVLAGLLFKLAAVPFHAWAPGTYEGAPLPIAVWLATASKLGGVVAVLLVVGVAFHPVLGLVGPVIALVAIATMTIGNLVALRERRLIRLLAWSGIAQTGYLIAPLGVFATAAGRDAASIRAALAGVVAFTMLYLVLSAGTFAAVAALRQASDRLETVDDLAGAARRAPWATAAFILGLAGLAGLPPGLAGLFAKVTVIRATLDGSAGWLAVAVALNAVIGLAYYAWLGAACFGTRAGVARAGRVSHPVAVAAGGLALVALVLGIWPQWVLDAARAVADSLT